MISVSSEFHEASIATTRYLAVRLDVQWDGDTWFQETDIDGENYLKGFTLRQLLDEPGADRFAPLGTVDVMQITLDNSTRRFDRYHTAGDDSIRAYIDGDKGMMGIKVRLYIGFWLAAVDVEYVRIFSGIIYSGDPQGENNFVLNVRDGGFDLVQKRLSTTLLDNTTADELISYLAEAGGKSTDEMELDASPYIIKYAWTDDDATLEECQRVAQATGGRVFYDAQDVLHYESFSSMALTTTPVVTLADSDLMRIIPKESPDSTADMVAVDYSPRYAGEVGVIHTLDEVTSIRAGEPETITIRLDSPAIAIYTPEPEDDYWILTAGGMVMHDHVTVVMVTYAQRAEVTITNEHPSLAADVVFLQLRGQPLVGGPTKKVELRTNTNQDEDEDTRDRTLRGNEYIQTEGMANAMCHLMKDRYRWNIPTWTLQGVPGIPHLELGDRIRFSSVRDLPVAREGYIVGITSRWTSPKRRRVDSQPVFRQDIEVMDAEKLFPRNDYFVVGESTLGEGGAWY